MFNNTEPISDGNFMVELKQMIFLNLKNRDFSEQRAKKVEYRISSSSFYSTRIWKELWTRQYQFKT